MKVRRGKKIKNMEGEQNQGDPRPQKVPGIT